MESSTKDRLLEASGTEEASVKEDGSRPQGAKDSGGLSGGGNASPQIPRTALPGNPVLGASQRIPKAITVTAIRPYSGVPLGYLGRTDGAPDTNPPEVALTGMEPVRREFRLTPIEREQFQSAPCSILKSATWTQAAAWISASAAPETTVASPAHLWSVAVDRQEEEEVGWGHHDTLVDKWATVEREEKEAAAAAEMHAMSYPVVVVRHNMLEGIRAQRLAEGAVPMAVCYLCAGEIFKGEFGSVACVSDNSKIHLKCAMVSFAADPNLLNLSCQCGDTGNVKVDGNGARPVCGGFSGALVDKAAREARVRGQEEALAHEAKLNALVEARTALDPARYESLPTLEEEVIGVTIIGLESETAQDTEERQRDWLKWVRARTSADQVVFKVKNIDTQGQAGTLLVTWPAATTSSETEKHMREVEGLIMSMAPQSARSGDSRHPGRGSVMRSQDGERMRTMSLLIQLVVDSSQFPPAFRRTKVVEGLRYKIKPIPAGAMRGLAQRIDRIALPSFTQELGDPAFDTAVAMLKVKRPSFQVDSEHNHGKRPAEREEAANDYSQKSPSYDRGSPHGGEGRPRTQGQRGNHHNQTRRSGNRQ